MHVFRHFTHLTISRIPPFLWLVLLALGLAACGDPAPPVTPGTATSSTIAGLPVPSGELRAVTLVGTIQEVVESTRTLALAEPVEGVARVLVTDESGIHQVGRTGLVFADLRPGMRMEASGVAGSDGMMLAQDILIIGTGAGDGPSALPPLDVLEQSISGFYRAVGSRQPAVARQFLTPALNAQLSDSDLSVGPGVRTLGVVFIQSSSITPSRVIYTVGVVVQPGEGDIGEWQAGQNNRYLEFLPTAQGWRIARISSDPIG